MTGGYMRMGGKGQEWAVSAPDLSVTITDREALLAVRIFDRTDWDGLELEAAGRRDALGRPVDRRNPSVRLALLAEAVARVRGAKDGEGIDLMSNPYYESMVRALLKARDDLRGEA
jgi:hypothetical protein